MNTVLLNGVLKISPYKIGMYVILYMTVISILIGVLS